MGLLQKEAAQQLGVTPWTVLNWEKGHTVPLVSAMPAIYQFLGYDPFPDPKTFPEQLLVKRREMGWSIKTAAEFIGVDPSTWGHWECGRSILHRQHRIRVARLLEICG